jgi:hypothetical protein
MASKKRASGEGTIRKRSNGLWEARLSIPGQYKTKSFYGKTQADARRKREEARKALEAGHSLDSQRQTVGEYLEGWIEGPLKGSVAPKTYADYAWICRKHLIPEIGRVRLSKLTAEDLDRLYARKTAVGLGPRTVGYIYSTIRVALQRAVKKRLIPYNVARDAEPRYEDLVFLSLGGGPMDRDNLAARHFKPLLKRANLPDIRLYDLRHTFATLWLESGEHPKFYKRSSATLGYPSL